MAEGNNITVCSVSEDILMGGEWSLVGFNMEELSMYLFPVLVMQTFMILVVTHFFAYLLEPYGQPRIVAKLMGAILLGPTVFGKLTYNSVSVAEEEPGENAEEAKGLGRVVVKSLAQYFFPTTSYALVQAIGFLGLIYYVFLIAVGLDLKVFKVMGKKVLAIATTSIAIPVLVALAATTVVGLPAPMASSSYKASGTEQMAFVLLLSVALSITSFPVLAHLLAELKIPNAEVGHLVLPSALVGDVLAWVLLAVCFALIGDMDEVAAQSESDLLAPLWMLLAGAFLVLVCVYAIKPILEWIDQQTPEGERVNNTYMGLVLIIVLAVAHASATIGFHPVFGALVLGLSVPKGRLATSLIEQLHDFVIGFMLPFLIVSSGLTADVMSIMEPEENEPPYYVLRLGFVIVIAALAKVAGSVIVSSFYSMSRSQGLSLGILMSTMGPAQLIILNMGKHEKVFNQKIYTLLMAASIVSATLVNPLLKALDKKSRNLVVYEQRNLQLSGPDSDLRLLACVHTIRNVPSITSLLELSRPINDSSLFVYAVHLVELTGRTHPMLIVHEPDSNGTLATRNLSNTPAGLVQSAQIVSTFEKYQQHAGSGVTVQSFTSVSANSSMHEDICKIAEDYKATCIVLPFHKLLTVDGEMEVLNPAIRIVNQGVISYAPCSVAILVDRGVGENGKKANAGHHTLRIALLFFGGPDDREAVMLARRFAEQQGVFLTMVRFVLGGDASAYADAISAKVEQRLDNECIMKFRNRFASNTLVEYTEVVVKDCAEAVTTIRAMDGIYNFFVVGKASGGDSPLLAAMTEFIEFPELGPIGDLLISADLGAMASVLAVQQYEEERREWGTEAESTHRRKQRIRPDGYSSMNMTLS